MSVSTPDYAHLINDKFSELFNQRPIIIRSPGRINLIGEHTDYNMGFVLPAAIDKAIYLGIQKRTDNEIHLHALDYNDDHKTSLTQIVRSGKLWPDYILGVIDQCFANRSIPCGVNIVFGGDIPPGAGLSSSAALECAAAYALDKLFGLGLGKLEMVKIAQAAENDFVGMKCGIMDQFASMFGKKDHLIRLDCRSLEYAHIPFKLNDITVVLFDTRVKHSLASSAYNERREQCEEGVRLIRTYHPEVESLRDVTPDMLIRYVKPVDELIYSRCIFIVSEIERLLAGCQDLENNDLESFGKRMFETHYGLSNLYEVSCQELDILVDLVKENPDVLGSRMMGGGFGGCTINLVKSTGVKQLIHNVSKGYKNITGTEIAVHNFEIEEGTSLIQDR